MRLTCVPKLVQQRVKSLMRPGDGDARTDRPPRAIDGRLVKSGMWVLFGRVSGIIAIVILNAMLARQLSYEEFGAFCVLKSVAAALAIAAMLGWNSVLVRFIAERFGLGDP